MRAIRFLCAVIVTLSLILLSVDKNFAAGPKYPTKPIQVVVAFAPGDTDVILRPFVEKMPDYLGQPMTIVYKPGAAGALGATFVVNSNPDGHTLLGSTQSAMVVIPLTQTRGQLHPRFVHPHLRCGGVLSNVVGAVQCPLEKPSRAGGGGQEESRE